MIRSTVLVQPNLLPLIRLIRLGFKLLYTITKFFPISHPRSQTGWELLQIGQPSGQGVISPRWLIMLVQYPNLVQINNPIDMASIHWILSIQVQNRWSFIEWWPAVNVLIMVNSTRGALLDHFYMQYLFPYSCLIISVLVYYIPFHWLESGIGSSVDWKATYSVTYPEAKFIRFKNFQLTTILYPFPFQHPLLPDPNPAQIRITTTPIVGPQFQSWNTTTNSINSPNKKNYHYHSFDRHCSRDHCRYRYHNYIDQSRSESNWPWLWIWLRVSRSWFWSWP